MPGPVLVAENPRALQSAEILQPWDGHVFAHVSPLCTHTHQIKSVGVNPLPSSSQVIISKAFAELQEPIKQFHSHNAC